ncbi:DNA repair protein RecN [Nakamurella antarctica]|uniref:DNA repair protein RecN n=1 Tax=Nakamurella antarctica TaxID=1902245 RepID=A0A3G8ZRF6_9ACTN|nr:DNA repair protein RecN [Nakamurella antarctica]
MLTELRITGLGVIDDAVLELHSGLTVVTGETGAGKTMVVTALGLIAGGRGDAARVRIGSEKTTVEARFEVGEGSAAGAIAAAAGGQLDDDGSLIALRTVSSDGRTRAHLGGRSAPVASLTEAIDTLLAIHGQSEAITLLRPTQQRAVLDRYAGLHDLLGQYRQLRKEWLSARAELADRVARIQERAQREQVLRLGLEEIAKIAPLPAEDREIAAESRRLDNADALRSAADEARVSLVGGEDMSDAAQAVGMVESARKLLESSDDERLQQIAAGLRESSAILTDAAMELSAYLADLDADPERLQELLARQAALKALTRRYGSDVDDVLRWSTAAAQELADLDSSEEVLEGLRQLQQEKAVKVAKVGAELTAHRSAAAAKLGRLATSELENLAMGRATLRIGVSQQEVAVSHEESVTVGKRHLLAGPEGLDSVEILLTSHADAPELPLQRGASGGELSRVMLALEVVLAEAEPVGTLVFDEVDAGVGGRAATEIGRLLARLGRTHQVIVVTHLAQVAAFADRQLVVNATEDGAVRSSSVRAATGSDRETELARMLGGTDTATARAHAADLLSAARAQIARDARTAVGVESRVPANAGEAVSKSGVPAKRKLAKNPASPL